MSIKGKKITVGLTGGIACYKVPYLVRALVKEGAIVKVVMTNAATKFITPLTLETVSGHPVATNMFSDNKFVGTRHIDLAQDTDLIVIAPATANFLGKAASGVSDDLLTTVVCASSCPVLIAPAMNPQMWQNPITQRNLKILEDVGYHFVGPAEGDMACDSTGVGRMVEPDELFKSVKKLLKSRKKKGQETLNGKKVLVTAGPTREAIDPVRFISNHSSGKMGFALAASAVAAGAETTLITGPTSLTPPANCHVIKIETTEQLLNEVKKSFSDTDCLIMAAAPADYRPAKISTTKIKKGGEGAPDLELEPTPDILKSISGKKRKDQKIVGFALETDNAIENGRKKLKEKNLDMILVNSVSEKTGFNCDTNQVTLLVPRRKPQIWPLDDKRAIADRLIDLLSTML